MTMTLSPESQILILNACCAAIAYGGILPSLRRKTLARVAACDAVVAALAIATAGALFAGRGLSFDLIVARTGWLGFAVITLALIEAPLAARFIRRHNLGGMA